MKKNCFKKTYKWFSDPAHLIFIIPVSMFLLILYLKTDINSFLVSAVSAFSGAWAAFLYNDYSNKKYEKLKNKAALIKADYIIDKLLLAHKQLEAHINKNNDLTNERFFEWEKIPEYDWRVYLPEIEVKDLLFLLEFNKEGKETLDSILLVNAENRDVVDILKKRNEMYGSYLDKTEDRGFIQKDQLEKIIGTKKFVRLQQDTQSLIDTNKNLLEDCGKAKNNIQNFIDSY